jgi:glutamate-1-semialdehyde 2,1-aminomutase
MKTVIIIQARMGSYRLPGKVMKKISGIPTIGLILKRLEKTKEADQIVVATSKSSKEKKLIKYLKKIKANYFCGSENDVVNRFYNTAKKYKAKIIVRITADCPLVDINIVDDFIKKFKNKRIDYLSNCLPYSYPNGMDIEVFSYRLLKKVEKNATTYHRQNSGVIIRYLKENFNSIKSINIICPIKKIPKYRLTVDYKSDLQLVRKIYKNFRPNIYFGLKEVLKLAKKEKKLFKTNLIVKSKLDKGQYLWKKANKLILGGNSLLSKNPNLFLPDKWPTYFSKSKGCKIWDLNNTPFTDMSLMGVGTNILGYCNHEVDGAVKKVIQKGNLTTLNCPEEVYLAEKLLNMHPWAGKVKFARTGGEANAMAIRIARTVSGKEKVAFCGYHGWHDWYLAANLRNKNSLNKHLLFGLDPRGVSKNLKNTSFAFEYNNINQLNKLIKKENIGVIKMEVSRTTQPNVKFLKQVRNIATKKNIVLIFDECTSGFRQSFGGLHKLININPDMAVFGKALGNGYAITAVLGKDSIMESAKTSFISSTFWTDRIGPVAAIKTLEIMEREKSWEKISYLGNKIFVIWKKLAKKHNLSINITGLPSLAKFSFNSKNSQAYKTFITQEMLKYKFLAANGVYLSTSHNEKILKKYSNYLDEIFYKISECEKGNISILDILIYPISQIPFSRLN